MTLESQSDVFTYEEFVFILGGNTAVPNYLTVDIYRNYLLHKIR